MNGAERICATLVDLGVVVVFGLPGSQNVVLYEALRRSGVRSVTASDEGAAAFMAAGYARASGRVGVLTTIPGPGFLYALPGITEARDDSAALLWLTLRQPPDVQAFPLQRIDQADVARSLVKHCHFIERPEDLAPVLHLAARQAASGEPGPVLVEVDTALLTQDAPTTESPADEVDIPGVTSEVLERLRLARRPLLWVGQGAQGSFRALRNLVHRWRVPVCSTCSGRGVVPDDDPHALVADLSFGVPAWLDQAIGSADLVLVLGCKFTHNGSAGGRLHLPAEKLVRIDTSAAVLAANYPAQFQVCARIEDFIASVMSAELAESAWTASEIAALRALSIEDRAKAFDHQPAIVAPDIPDLHALFDTIASAFGPDVVYTTDAGLHQALVRRYAHVNSAGGLLCPSDFQSMGFGLPGAIGAGLARPGATVVACVGDGALALSLGELMTATREGVDIVVVVFNDGAYGLIQRQQLMTFGYEHATSLLNPDFSVLAQAIGCGYFSVANDGAAAFQAAAASRGLRLIEVECTSPTSLRRNAFKSAMREGVVRSMPAPALQWMKRMRRR